MSGGREPDPGQEPPRRGPFRELRVAAMLSTVGLTLALSVAIGAGIGYLLDRWLRTNWLVIVFTIIGVGAGFKQLIQTVIRAGREQDEMEAQDRAARRAGQAARDGELGRDEGDGVDGGGDSGADGL